LLTIFPKFRTVWNLYEQISIAALDTGDTNISNECITLLMKKFPESARVGRLLGMQLEQAGKYEGALEVYAELLKKNPANLMIMKRKVRVCCSTCDCTVWLLRVFACGPDTPCRITVQSFCAEATFCCCSYYTHQVCVFKAMGDRKREVEELNALLRQFPAESATWQELGDTYLALCDLPVSHTFVNCVHCMLLCRSVLRFSAIPAYW
jgi:tetratricopeptide (TPR) repeat protein